MSFGSQLGLGFRWYRDSLASIRKEPLSFTSTVVFYAMMMALLGMVPIVGIVLAGLFWPYGTVLVAAAGRDSLQGKRPTVLPMIDAFRQAENRMRMIRIGLFYSVVVVTVAVILAVLGPSPEELPDSANLSEALNTIPYGAVVASLAVYIPATMALWFAPLLIQQKNMQITKALFISFTGCLGNFAAIVTALLLAFVTFMLAIAAVALILGSMGLSDIAVFVLFPLSLFGTALVYGTYYPMWHSVFSGLTPDQEKTDGTSQI